MDLCQRRSNVSLIPVSTHSHVPSDRTIRSLSPQVTALGHFVGRKHIQPYSRILSGIFLAFGATRPVLARQTASKGHAYVWNAWERGAFSGPMLDVCPKILQSAADCLICWQVAASPLHLREQAV